MYIPTYSCMSACINMDVNLYIEKGILVGLFLFPGCTDLAILITKCKGMPGVIYFRTVL